MASLPLGSKVYSTTLTNADKYVFYDYFLGRPSNSPLRDIPHSQQFSYFYPRVKRVVYHEPATIVFWTDGTKTVVKCIDGQPYEKYAGFCAALAKKIYGGTSTAKKIAGAKDKPVKIEVEEPVNEEPLAGELVTAESVADEVVAEEINENDTAGQAE